jgi:hypothetical protein
MTDSLEAPDFDPGMTGYATVVQDGVGHAITSNTPDSESTVCGKKIVRQHHETDEIGPRSDFINNGIEWCSACWPDHISRRRESEDDRDE